MFRQKLQSFHVLTKALDVILVLLTPSFTLFSSCKSFQGRCNCGEDLKNDGGGDVRTDALVTAPRSPHPVAMKDTEIHLCDILCDILSLRLSRRHYEDNRKTWKHCEEDHMKVMKMIWRLWSRSQGIERIEDVEGCWRCGRLQGTQGEETHTAQAATEQLINEA